MSTQNSQTNLPKPRSALSELRSLARRFNGRAAILGKGPSFADYEPGKDPAARFTVGLNETALRTRCDASFIIDRDILERAGPEIAASGISLLITPRVTHKAISQIGGLTIYGPDQSSAVSEQWASSFYGRHGVFNLSTAEPDSSFGPTIQTGNFSAPILAELLAQAGFDDILLAGVDGGSAYASAFKDVEYKKLRSIQDDFDLQFQELRAVRDRHGVKFCSARCETPFVMIGTEAEQCLATEVLKWSIESSTFLTVRYVDGDSLSRAMFAQGESGTPFSFQRIFLPELAGHKGRGLYFDSDMLVFKDVFELFNTDMKGQTLMGCAPTPGRRAQFSVFLVDNSKASWEGKRVLHDYQSGKVTYNEVMKDFCFVGSKSSALPMAWNSLEIFEPGATANIHFTDMGTQPWLSVYNPNAALWCEALLKALNQRPATVAALETSLANGWIRPSLRWQVEKGRSDPWILPSSVKALDQAWLPPHVRLRMTSGSSTLQLIKWRLASRVRRSLQSRTYLKLLRATSAIRKVFGTAGMR